MVISLGYVSSLGSPLEGPLVALINGPASAFRNLWKFDPLVRLPVAMGLAHLLAAPWRNKARTVSTRAVLRAVAAVAIASLVLPTAATGLASPGSFSQIPSYWVAAGGWLTGHAGNQAVLVEPGAGFSKYTWGSPMDDVLQGLTNIDFAERNLGVVGSAGNERLLDAIDQEFAAGDGFSRADDSTGPDGHEVRAGPQRPGGAAAHRDLASPGPGHDRRLPRPDAGGAVRPGGARRRAAGRARRRHRAVSRDRGLPGGRRAGGGRGPAGRGHAARDGAPESLITLANEGLLGASPVLLNSDGAGERRRDGRD